MTQPSINNHTLKQSIQAKLTRKFYPQSLQSEIEKLKKGLTIDVSKELQRKLTADSVLHQYIYTS